MLKFCRCLVCTFVLLFFNQWALAAKVIETEHYFIHFSEGESDLASRLAADCQPMAAFLERWGLPVHTPLYIVLDDRLDQPRIDVDMYPHREIRLPLRAPGVLEDGFSEADPWQYFLFKGLCLQGIYSERSGIPGGLHLAFGEIISPNMILPDWVIDGVSHLLYEKYLQRPVSDPLMESIFKSSPIPKLDKVSNHPEVWPGRFSYRIYGRPFIRWLNTRYGWNKLLFFLQLHGRGVVPIEIDSKCRRAFGASGSQLWRAFQVEHSPMALDGQGHPIIGYWNDPYVYWNATGVYPGLKKNGARGRYGYVDEAGWLWLSEYEGGVARLKSQYGDKVRMAVRKHVWDPGPGSVAVTRQGRRPFLLLNTHMPENSLHQNVSDALPKERLIAGPPQAIQLSGPVMDARGRIAVAANQNGNWDIWVYDGAWHQVTSLPSIEMDPWFAGDQLVFASNATGNFQIHAQDMQPLTHVTTAAVLPRKDVYLHLEKAGWEIMPLAADDASPPSRPLAALQPSAAEAPTPAYKIGDYSPFRSIWPNYIMPDLYIDNSNFQFGFSTEGRDVSKEYLWDAGVRYDVDDSDFSWRVGGQAKQFTLRATRYPMSYTTQRFIELDESRLEIKAAWSPLQIKSFEISANWRRYKPDNDDSRAQEEWWGALSWDKTIGNFSTNLNLDVFNDNSRSLYGRIMFWSGQRIITVLQLQAGKTWGDLKPGHNSFRIGGNTGEGFFTQRPTRLFPLRGFDADILDDAQAAVASVETFWPLASLQTGYKTLPLFLHNISVGTFVDCGFAAEHPSNEDLLMSAGFELITGMELAWGFMANFRLGWAWPLRQPDDLNQSGPQFLIQIGRPL